MKTPAPAQRFVRQEVLGIQALPWGADAGLPLKWGYNPYPPSPRVATAMAQAMHLLERYPSPQLKADLAVQYAHYAGIRAEQVLVTNGCDKALRLIAEVFINPGDELITFVPTFPPIEESTRLMGGKIRRVPLTADYRVPPLEELRETVISPRTKLIYVVNPNNPTTALTIDEAGLRELLSLEAIVVLDEAYFELGGWTATAWLAEYPNLIILRSLSKSFSLPALRVGFTLCNEELAEPMRRFEHSVEVFNVSSLSLIGAMAALEDIEYYRDNWRKLSDYRQRMADEIRSWGVEVLDSRTTCLWLRVPWTTADDIRQSFAEAGISLKNMGLFSNVTPHDCLIGLPRSADYARVMQVLQQSLKLPSVPAFA